MFPLLERSRPPRIGSYRIGLPALVFGLFLLAWGCGGSGSAGDSAGGEPENLNTGPMATESMSLNPGLADYGEKLFKDKACITCHAVGERKQGPDLSGVAARRTERWLRRQIMDPEWMLKNDPIARELMGEYALQMANQQVTEQQATALIQYLLRETLNAE